jgi:WD40 repeat protein
MTFAGDPNGFVESVVFSPSGSTLVSSSPFTHEVRFWRVSDGVELLMYGKETGWGPTVVLPLATSANGVYFAFGERGCERGAGAQSTPLRARR